MAPLRALFTKSVVAARDLPAGTVLSREHLAFKKPGTGFPASEYETLIGRRLKRGVARDDFIQLSDVA